MKVALQTIWEELSQQHQQDGGNVYQALACLRDCQMVHGHFKHLLFFSQFHNVKIL